MQSFHPRGTLPSTLSPCIAINSSFIDGTIAGICLLTVGSTCSMRVTKDTPPPFPAYTRKTKNKPRFSTFSLGWTVEDGVGTQLYAQSETTHPFTVAGEPSAPSQSLVNHPPLHSRWWTIRPFTENQSLVNHPPLHSRWWTTHPFTAAGEPSAPSQKTSRWWTTHPFTAAGCLLFWVKSL